MNAQPGPTVKNVVSTPASYEQDADMFDDFFKSIPEKSLLGGPPKPVADLLRGFKFNQVQGCTFNFTFKI